jgi:hypothetical protein
MGGAHLLTNIIEQCGWCAPGPIRRSKPRGPLKGGDGERRRRRPADGERLPERDPVWRRFFSLLSLHEHAQLTRQGIVYFPSVCRVAVM